MARPDALAVDERSDPETGAERTPECTPDWETVADLPASAKLVARVLEHEGTLSGTEIAEETRLPARTVRYAVGRLGEAGVVSEAFSLRDAREKRYELRID
jgi:DNA-binding MarR family transcriptional regulator